MRRLFAIGSAASALVALFCCNDPYDAADARAIAPDAAAEDTGGGTDARTDDASTDGAIEAARDPDAGCGHFPDAAFCEDFDQPNSLTPNVWTTIDTPLDGSTLALTSDDRVSAPNAVRITLPPATSCGTLQAQRVFPGAHSTLTTKLAVRAKTPGIFLTIDSTGSSSSSAWTAVAAGFDDATTLRFRRYADAGASVAYEVTFDLATSAFIQWVEVEVEFNTVTRYATLRVGTQLVDIPIPVEVELSSPRIGIGPACDSEADLRVDDVAVFVTP